MLAKSRLGCCIVGLRLSCVSIDRVSFSVTVCFGVIQFFWPSLDKLILSCPKPQKAAFDLWCSCFGPYLAKVTVAFDFQILLTHENGSHAMAEGTFPLVVALQFDCPVPLPRHKLQKSRLAFTHNDGCHFLRGGSCPFFVFHQGRRSARFKPPRQARSCWRRWWHWVR